MTDEDGLTAVDEARLVGMSAATVCRMRQDPSHPVHGPRAVRHVIGARTYMKVPRGDIVAWWPPKFFTLPATYWRKLVSCNGEIDRLPETTRRMLERRGYIVAGRVTDVVNEAIKKSI